MPEKTKIKNHLQEGLKEYSQALDEYCRDLGWDSKKLKLSLTGEGIVDDVLYLEDPNSRIIDIMALFLSRPESSIFVICAPEGMGKTSVRDFAVRALNSSDDFYISATNNPGTTPLWLLKEILKDLNSADEAPRTLDLVWNKLATRLLELREAGISTVVWIDKAEKLDSTAFLILRTLANVRTFAGEKACKVILTGRLPLKKKVKNLFEQSSNNPDACGDFSEFLTFELEKWNADNISSWWELLSEFCSTTVNPTNPFSGNAAEIVLEFSGGNPRSIVQLTRLILFEKAFRCHGKESEKESEKES
ncbi:TPA: ATP-binding protein, partial [Methanosarcinaceae archaeon]|nr:ATP-binding protein [Methanosarcinaceae archaeon]